MLHRAVPVAPAVSAQARRGVFLIVSALCLAAVMVFVAFSVDLGIVSLTKTQMQNATDAAALAAAMEITNAISTSGPDVQDVFEYAKTQARTQAQKVGSLNGIYVNPGSDVVFGRRYQSGNSYVIDWNAGSSQINVVKVIARRDSDTKGAQDAKVPGVFSAAFGSQGSKLKTESIAFIEPRDMVIVHDFSRSMNFDSYFADEQNNQLSQSQIESNLKLVWDDLGITLGTMTFTPQYAKQSKTGSSSTATVTYKGASLAVSTNTKLKSVKLYFENGSSQTFSISNETTTSGAWAGTGSQAGLRIKGADITIRQLGPTNKTVSLTGYAYDEAAVKTSFGLSSSYPYAAGSWSEYIEYVKESETLAERGYRDLYGGLTWLCYTMRYYPSQNETKDLWKTRHYPFHAIKEGHELLCDYLSNLGFDDRLGMVSYDLSHRVEKQITDNNPDFPQVDISSNPITNNFSAVKNLMRYKQAAHYSDYTNMSGGMKDAIALLDQYKRSGSRPAIVLMTDGNGNVYDPGENGALPGGWSWGAQFDYDNDGTGDYQASSTSAKATLKYVKQAVDKGYTVHAISVGVDADRDLLKAVAWLGNGYYIDVPGGQSVSDMEDTVKAAFQKIAAAVPPARLVKGD